MKPNISKLAQTWVMNNVNVYLLKAMIVDRMDDDFGLNKEMTCKSAFVQPVLTDAHGRYFTVDLLHTFGYLSDQDRRALYLAEDVLDGDKEIAKVVEQLTTAIATLLTALVDLPGTVTLSWESDEEDQLNERAFGIGYYEMILPGVAVL